MPWVRLHGTKDYYGMALHLKEVPEVRCTINLVPSLLVQIQAYTERGLEDRHLRVSRIPADGLSHEDSLYLMDNFFMANPDQMIRPHRRYFELYQQRAAWVDPAERALKRFSTCDLCDLQVWSNLAWMHPLVFEQEDDLREFLQKERGYTEEEKNWFLDKQLEILARVIPLHRQLAEQGQVELTTTPFYHPILPLLWDKRLALEAMPDASLPRFTVPYREDADLQIRRAVEFHKKLFGQAPRGMWPSEGSVCQGIVPMIADAGIEWIATDEEILSRSTHGHVARDPRGHVRHPELLYQPWRVEEQGRELQIIFRDHALSDLIGFHYQRTDAPRAVDDFLGSIEAIGQAVQANDGSRPTLVSVILDGENCWEYYPNGGVDFLRTLYQRCALSSHVNTTRVSDYLSRFPATDRLGRLFPGSWISHNFRIWIGHSEDNQAWDVLHQTRQHLRRANEQPKVPREVLDRAWEELYIAQGSDWFWWYGDDHSSMQDALFDYLFRKHLQNVYLILGEQPPADLSRVISRAHREQVHTEPKAFLRIRLDGQRRFFEWVDAGHYSCRSERGTMALATGGVLSEIFFGFDQEHLLVRVDTQGPAQTALEECDTLRVVFLEPEGYELVVSHPAWETPLIKLYRNEQPLPEARLEVASKLVVEMQVAFDDLGLSQGDPIHFFVELLGDAQSRDRAPREGAIELVTPSPDFEQIMWQV